MNALHVKMHFLCMHVIEIVPMLSQKSGLDRCAGTSILVSSFVVTLKNGPCYTCMLKFCRMQSRRFALMTLKQSQFWTHSHVHMFMSFFLETRKLEYWPSSNKSVLKRRLNTAFEI
jgi:hypothetical protein